MNPSVRRFLLAFVGWAVWTEAGYLLSGRVHFVYRYDVAEGGPCLDWRLLLLACAGLLLAVGAWRAAGEGRAGFEKGSLRPALWLISCAAIPIVEGLRQTGLPVARTFLEPLLFALASGMAAWTTIRRVRWGPQGPQLATRIPWFWCVAAAAVGCGAWWYYQAEAAYSNYLLGFHDFADFARRVANTWEGRGFLARSPVWPAFFDHVNPGLVLLVPFWGLWPDARLFLLIQAVCLALPSLLVYAIARRLGASKAGAAAWAGAYLAFPAVGQLNLAYSYGFHAVSLALPLLFAAIWSCLCRRPWLGLGLAILACTFKENVLVAVSGLALALAVLEAIDRSAGRKAANLPQEQTRVTGLAPRLWLTVAGGFFVAFVLVIYGFGLTGPAGTWRFANLGQTSWEVVLSPMLRPRVFWPAVFKSSSAYYLLALVVPAGLPSVVRGWPILIGLAAPVTVLLAWDFDGATSIAFQYVTLLIPVVLLAAMIGARRRPGQREAGSPDPLGSAGLLALTSSAVASLFIGALPFSRATTPFTLSSEEVAAREHYRTVLDQAAEMAGGRRATVLASGRLASHLLGVERLEMVRHALQALDALRREAGPDKRWIEVFEWVAVDLNDRSLHHSLTELAECVLAAESAGYRAVFARFGVLVYRRPGPGQAPMPDALSPWRVPDELAADLARRRDAIVIAPGLRVGAIRARAGRTGSGPLEIEVEFVLQATEDRPAEYFVRLRIRSQDGRLVADTGLRPPVEGNRPTSWWKRGEAWRERYTIPMLEAPGPGGLYHEFLAEPYEHPFDTGPLN